MAREAARQVVSESGITLAEYKGYHEDGGNELGTRYAREIGEDILNLIEEWYSDTLDADRESLGAMLIQEIMITSDSEIAYALGKHYLPEPADMSEALSDSVENILDDDSEDDEDGFDLSDYVEAARPE